MATTPGPGNDWRAPGDLAEWAHRRQVAAEWIPPGQTVLEVGALNCKLGELLHPSCVYLPSDKHARPCGGVVIDLNATPLALPTHGVFVALGVLEWLEPGRAAAALNAAAEAGAQRAVVSYGLGDGAPWDWEFKTQAQFLEMARQSRWPTLHAVLTYSRAQPARRLFVLER